MNTNYSRGQELWGKIKWPVSADLIIDAETKKPKAVRVMTADGSIIANMTDVQEAAGLAQLLNFLQEVSDFHEHEVQELRIYTHEIEEFKKKYWDLLPKYEEAMKQLYPLKTVETQNSAQQADRSPARRMVEVTGTQEFIYGGEDGRYRQTAPAKEDER